MLARYTIAFSCCLAATLQGPHVDLGALLADVLKPAELQSLVAHPNRIEFSLQVSGRMVDNKGSASTRIRWLVRR